MLKLEWRKIKKRFFASLSKSKKVEKKVEKIKKRLDKIY